MRTDEDIVREIIRGRIDLFEELVIRYEKKIFGLSLRMMGNREDASDATQEAFLRAYRFLHTYKQQAKFSTWLFRIASNACLDMLRKRQKYVTVSLDQPLQGSEGDLTMQLVDEQDGPEEQLQKKELVEALAEAIQELSPEQRLVIILRDVQGLAYDDISKILKLPMGTVKSRLNRARAAIRELMQENKELLPYALRLNK